ncbi:phage portal protein [Lysinibacillus sp. FJAT-14745]|uniref:DUF2577 domain-containing protein n=1 Tax=Lysinibacillus sp. FJAT-14745 TaxID=1704289 RepID=UPI0006ABC741|nr:DUF2577 domain-containing protein [Lysinibacillus sp. FJAT-14745]KOP78749.1 phage portal protein [Lysinibacillus sp. FJAT-14745]
MSDILKLIKRIAIDAVNSQKLSNIVYGTVISISPLKVQIDQKLILEEVHLKLTRAVQDYEVEMSVSNGAKQIYKIYNGLVQDDKVTMIRAQGGQQYIIIDKEVVE